MGPASKLNSMPKYVVSSTLKKAMWDNTEKMITDQVADEIGKLKHQIDGDILITGSATLVQSLMKTRLIDEYKFLVHPIIVGHGKRCFTDGVQTTELRLVDNKPLGLGVMLLCYQPTID